MILDAQTIERARLSGTVHTLITLLHQPLLDYIIGQASEINDREILIDVNIASNDFKQLNMTIVKYKKVSSGLILELI